MSRYSPPKNRCPACGDPSARPVHLGCQGRLDRKEAKAVAAAAAAAAAKKEAKKKSKKELAKEPAK